MKYQQLELFIQWFQSPQVQLAVGIGKNEVIYRLPVEFLRKRSITFHKTAPEEWKQDVVRFEELSSTSAETFNAFMAWITAAKPQIEQEDSLEDTVELGILADRLRVWALSNQTVDLIESQLESGAWKWSPESVDSIYSKVAEDQPLRRLVQAKLLNTLDHPNISMDDDEEKAWDQVFLAHAALGCDYRRAKRTQEIKHSRWPVQKIPCEYHEHPWAEMREGEEIETNGMVCAHEADDCYPVWKVQDVSYAEPEEEIEVVRPTEGSIFILRTNHEPELPYEADPEPVIEVELEPILEAEPEPFLEVEPEPVLEAEPSPPLSMANEDTMIAEVEMIREGDAIAVEEEEKPRMTMRALKAEIEFLGKKDRKKLKKWMHSNLLEIVE